MLNHTLLIAALLATALLFGGMLLFAGGFAAFALKALPPVEARLLIRAAFPPFTRSSSSRPHSLPYWPGRWMPRARWPWP